MENETMESGKAESSDSKTAPDEQDGHPSQEASSLHALASYRLCALGFKDLPIFKNKAGIDARIEEHILVGIEHLGSGFYAFGRSKLYFYDRARHSFGAAIGLTMMSAATRHRHLQTVQLLEKDIIPSLGALIRKLEFREQDRMQKVTTRRQNNPEKEAGAMPQAEAK